MKNKIFCIGLNKTGTSSLHKAFKVLGIKSVHYQDDWGNNIKNIIEQNYLSGKNILEGLDKYEAFTDWDKDETAHLIFKEFDRQYPGSKFILNTRDMNGWLNSREKHVRRNQELQARRPRLNIPWTTLDRESWEKHYIRYHEEVHNYFRGREKDLLVFNVTEGDGWEKLCPFLGLPVPEKPFPRKNLEPKKMNSYQRLETKFNSFLKRMKKRTYRLVKY